MIDPIRRRTFLTLAGATGTAWALPAGASAIGDMPLVLTDARLSDEERAAALGSMQRSALLLDHVSVMSWRRELADVLQSGRSVTAYTRWDLSLLLADMARENGLGLRQSRLARGVLLTQIGYARRAS